MANQKHLDILKQGVETWNQWRKEHHDIQPDLSGADLTEAYLAEADLSRATLAGATLAGATLTEADLSRATLAGATLAGAYLAEADLSGADLSGANLIGATLTGATLTKPYLSGADLSGADLSGADLSGANLSRADLSGAFLSGAFLRSASLREADLRYAEIREALLSGANLSGADLRGVDLSRADLSGATLSGANLSDANLSGANLSEAILVGTKMHRTTLTNCRVYGIAVWDVDATETEQSNLIITASHINEPTITVDNLKIAQFIYLLLNNEEIRDVIDTLTTKSVLILGRFTPERKAVLDALREALRTHGYLPILFDFEKPSSRNMTETVRTLAHLSRFIIADLTDPSSIPQELYAIIPTLAIPVQPVLLEGKKEYAMLTDLLSTYHWMLPIHFYKDQADLLTTLKEDVIEPAEQKAQELAKR